jgi:flagellar basal body-associated protein FliL
MTDVQPPSADPNEIALDDIDALLEAEDPQFAKDLKAVAKIEAAQDVVIEASTEAGDVGPEKIEEGPKTFKDRSKLFVRNFFAGIKRRIKDGFVMMGHGLLVFLKTKPKEFALFSFVMLKSLIKNAYHPIKKFQESTGAQKLAWLLVIAAVPAAGWVLLANVKRGVWLPQINDPILSSFEYHATAVEDYDPKVQGESFYSAFPQERHDYLFPKMKVNLTRTEDNPNPMGAFEIIILLDSKDTAIEIADREVEFFDLLQRVIEEQTFPDLETELGKNRMKSHMKRELNQQLTQGWVKDISFKTFILKP